MKLHFYFEDIPYAARLGPGSPLSIRRRRGQVRLTAAQRGYGEGKTTAGVAKELEEKYHIVATFYEIEKDYIQDLINKYVMSEYTAAILRHEEEPHIEIPQEVLDKIVTRFKTNLSRRRYDGLISGVPTIAASRGVQHQFAHSYKKRGDRPSFIDTGMYQSTFRARAEEE